MTLGVADRRWLHTLVTAVLNRSAGDALRVVHEVNHYGFDLAHFSKDLVQFCRDLLVIRISGAHAQRITDLAESEFESMMHLVGGREVEDFERFLKIALQGANEMNLLMPKLSLRRWFEWLLATDRPMDDLLTPDDSGKRASGGCSDSVVRNSRGALCCRKVRPSKAEVDSVSSPHHGSDSAQQHQWRAVRRRSRADSPKHRKCPPSQWSRTSSNLRKSARANNGTHGGPDGRRERSRPL